MLSIKSILKLVSAATVVIGMSATSAQAIPYTNLALGGTASQSSTWQDNEGRNGAQKAIDDNTSGVWNFGAPLLNTLTHTNADRDGAWWQVDLGAVMYIDSITVWNRTDCCVNRMRDFDVLVDGVVKGTWDQQTGPTPSTTFSNINTNGQIVRIKLNTADFLHLAEVQVMGLRTPQDVSEPATLGLIGAGLVFAGLVARRRKQA